MSGKPRAAQLKSNVFNPLPPERSCHIKWKANESNAEADWSADSPPIDALKGIDIFDTDEALHYLTQESATTYIPSVVGLFEKLVTNGAIVIHTQRLKSDPGGNLLS
ncbi:TPA: hypothetical protein RPO27_004869 [Escherichia coli]|nr:hypothetical protein [Escherichia coli]